MNQTASGTESLLGIADGLSASEMRDNLALSTRYLSNWYKATDGSDNQSVWWGRIDHLRASIEATYKELTDPANTYFAGKAAIADYNAASQEWSGLFRDITFSADANQVSLLSQLPSLVDTIADPASWVPSIGNELGKAFGGLIGQFLRQTWPYLAVAGVVVVVYVFREPLAKLAGKAI